MKLEMQPKLMLLLDTTRPSPLVIVARAAVDHMDIFMFDHSDTQVKVYVADLPEAMQLRYWKKRMNCKEPDLLVL